MAKLQQPFAPDRYAVSYPADIPIYIPVGKIILWQPKGITYRHIDKLKNIDAFNYSMIYKIHEYIHTDFMLLVHYDGFVVNPDMWRILHSRPFEQMSVFTTDKSVFIKKTVIRFEGGERAMPSCLQGLLPEYFGQDRRLRERYGYWNGIR